MYTPEDHADMQLAHDHLHLASELINGVMERRRLDLNLQTISLLSSAKQDADNADRVLDEDDGPRRAIDLATHADREAGMAERYMNWRDGKPAA